MKQAGPPKKRCENLNNDFCLSTFGGEQWAVYSDVEPVINVTGCFGKAARLAS